MAKFVLPLEQLPPPMADGTQKFRFRIISEDRNVISYWSPIFKIINSKQIVPDSETTLKFSASAIYNNITDSISLVLSSDNSDYTDFLKNYDIFVNWDDAGYEFYNRMSANGISIANSGTSTIKIKGQYPSQYVTDDDGSIGPIETSSLKIFETSEINLIDLRDFSSVSASVSTLNTNIVQVQTDVQNVEGLVYALS